MLHLTPVAIDFKIQQIKSFNDLKLWLPTWQKILVPMGTGYQLEKNFLVSMDTGYRPEKKKFGYRGLLGTGQSFNDADPWILYS